MKHIGDVEYYNSEFQVLTTEVDNISDQHFLEAYIGGLKDEIKHELLFNNLEYFIEAMQFYHHIQAKNKATHKHTTGTYAGSIDRFVPHKAAQPQPN